ncbi:hypothetical protein SBV1_2340015 [Verrucomicrobia bacterium]|nr:hypothetical protein SBV1_2340015 [Verrucomicrobiota bacterium]
MKIQLDTKIQDWDESFLDLEDYQVERALAKAAIEAIHRARRFGTDFVVEEDGQPKSLRPHETAPYEQRFREDLERVNRKIAELEAKNPDALALNETPEPKPGQSGAKQ